MLFTIQIIIELQPINYIYDRENAYVAIMAGGIGSRFWPQSRESRPKQFLDILNTGKSLLQATYERFLHLVPPQNIYIVTNIRYVKFVAEQLPELDSMQIVAEPSMRNTAPCIAYIANKIAARHPDATMIVAPSDHLVLDTLVFHQLLSKALNFVEHHDALLTLGIKPNRAHTGYGYIQMDDNYKIDGVYKVKNFTEKPSAEIAHQFIKSGEFLWNSGIFVWKCNTILEAIEKYQPDIADIFKPNRKEYKKQVYNTSREKKFVAYAYSVVKNISIDYAVMEKADNAYVIPADFGWTDLGTWTSLWEQKEKDDLGNVVLGEKTLLYDSTNCLAVAPNEKLVIAHGLHGFFVVDTPDVLLICRLDAEQRIKDFNTEARLRFDKRYQ